MKTNLRKQRLYFGVFLLLGMLSLFTVATTPAKAQTSYPITTFAAYQEFENGFMIWREDSGEILAFVQSTNIVHRFPEAMYDHLPENPIWDSPPHNRVKPIRGFGRVWGNFDYVRQQLGWGLNSEFGYTTTISFTGYPYWIEQYTLPAGTYVEVYTDNSWAIAQPTQPPPPSYYTLGAIQEFENGRMLYASDSGTIWVLLNSGSAYTFHTYDYGHLPDNTITAPPPYGYLKPILGFGKVWGNYYNIRHALGWAITYEDSYHMQISSSYASTSIQLPNGQWVDMTHVGIWNYR